MEQVEESKTARPQPQRETNRLLLGEPSRAFDAEVDYGATVGPFVPAQVADEARLGPLRIAAASLQGAHHRQYGEPRQDCYEFAISADGRWAVIVVTDGLSDAVYSHIGAKVAAEKTRVLVADNVDLTVEDLLAVPQLVEADLERHFPNYLTDVATNLTFLAIELPTRTCFATRIGDGDILMRMPDQQWRSIFRDENPDQVTVESTTHAIPGDSASAQRSKFELAPNHVILIGSDGVLGPMMSSPDVVGAAFWSALAQPLPLTEYVRLVGFERRACFDDRTLVTLWHQGAQE